MISMTTIGAGAVDAVGEEDFEIAVAILELVLGGRGRVGPVALLVDDEGAVGTRLGTGDEQLGTVVHSWQNRIIPFRSTAWMAGMSRFEAPSKTWGASVP